MTVPTGGCYYVNALCGKTIMSRSVEREYNAVHRSSDALSKEKEERDHVNA